MYEFIIAHIVEEFDASKPFTMWPLHLTLLPWFDAPDIEKVQDAVRLVTQKFEPFTSEVEGTIAVGRGKQASRVVPNKTLQDLHSELLKMVNDQQWQLNGRYIGDQFKPHITSKAGRNFEGKEFTLDQVYIVEALPQQYRKVVSVIQLGK